MLTGSQLFTTANTSPKTSNDATVWKRSKANQQTSAICLKSHKAAMSQSCFVAAVTCTLCFIFPSVTLLGRWLLVWRYVQADTHFNSHVLRAKLSKWGSELQLSGVFYTRDLSSINFSVNQSTCLSFQVLTIFSHSILVNHCGPLSSWFCLSVVL